MNREQVKEAFLRVREITEQLTRKSAETPIVDCHFTFDDIEALMIVTAFMNSLFSQLEQKGVIYHAGEQNKD